MWQTEKAPEKWVLRVSMKISGTSRQKTGQLVCVQRFFGNFNLAMKVASLQQRT
jgi:hypothetical protein